METIRVLFYTDYLHINEDPNQDFGISELKKLILYKTQHFAHFEIELVNRHLDASTNLPVHAVNKLTPTFLKRYQELWVFGFVKSNLMSEPQNELTDDEVTALADWMVDGGVMISGDHANQDDRLGDQDPLKKDHSTYLCLGRALGQRIPRAGKLRIWEGPPTAEDDDPLNPRPLAVRDNLNTQEGVDIDLLDQLVFQSDPTAQHLLLVKRPRAHPIFWRNFDTNSNLPIPILKLPDHAHEGRLTIPKVLAPPEWPAPLPPATRKPEPEVIARGMDKRFDERFYDLLIAYDGDAAGVGRILADSSWHHFFNINLSGFKRESNSYPIAGSDLDQIAQLYGNLACWLVPLGIRTSIGQNLFLRLATHPLIMEIKGSSERVLGRTARQVLKHRFGLGNLQSLFGQTGFESASLPLASVINSVVLDSDNDPSFMGQEAFLGTIIKEYHDDFDSAGISDPTRIKTDQTTQARLDLRISKALTSRAAVIANSSAVALADTQALIKEANLPPTAG